MITINAITEWNGTKTWNEENAVVTADITVDTASELPETNGIEGYVLYMGSTAYVVADGEKYVLGSDGTWYKG